MCSLKIVCLVSALISVNAQDLTSIRTKHPKHFQPSGSYYPSEYYPNFKFKPGPSYKAIPPSYNPSDVCFNPNYYGIFDSRTSPVPQPNIYYVPSNAQPATPAYSPSAWSAQNPWIWNNYPYTGNSATTSQIKNTDQIGSSLPHVSPLSTPRFRSNEDSKNIHHHNETQPSPNIIKISRPTISVKIVPPSFNENATSVTNITPEPDTNTDQSTQTTRLDEKTRKMIKKLLEMGSRLGKSNRDERNIDSRDADTTSSTPIGIDQSRDVKSQISPRNEMVIMPSQQVSTNSENRYPLPKTTYGETNEPRSSYNRMKILTEFNPPA